MLNRLRTRVSATVRPVAAAFARSGLTPNQITVIGFVVSLFSAYLFFTRNQFFGGVLLLIAGFFDILDGAVAKITGKVTKFGGVLDSVLDRYSDLIVIAAIMIAGLCDLYSGTIALIGSVMVSYIRSRGEVEGIKMASVGLMERAERIVVLAVFALVGYVWIGVIVLAVLTQFTVAQRLYFLWKNLKV
jgi:archaetidylinositol phosphate synthase